jgi:hypothetical protein
MAPREQQRAISNILVHQRRNEPPCCHRLAHQLAFTKSAQEPDLTCKTPLVVGASDVAAQRITSVAWKRMDGGMVRPRAFAVDRLTTNSNHVGCSTGRSAGLVPFRILPT